MTNWPHIFRMEIKTLQTSGEETARDWSEHWATETGPNTPDDEREELCNKEGIIS